MNNKIKQWDIFGRQFFIIINNYKFLKLNLNTIIIKYYVIMKVYEEEGLNTHKHTCFYRN